MLVEMQEGTAEVDIASPGTKFFIPLPGVNVNPLKPILYPIQKELLKAVNYVRIAKTVVLWEETYYSFWLVTFAFVASALVFFIPWAFLLRWALRISAWLLLGPWMMLVDKYYFQKNAVTKNEVTDEAIRERIKQRYNSAFEGATNARVRKENALKLQAMKCFCFGKYLIETSVFNEDLFWDTPLPESYATPCTDPPSINIVETRYGQQLTGDMVPQREVHLSGQKGRKKHIINRSLLQRGISKGISMPQHQLLRVGKGVGKVVDSIWKNTPYSKPFQRGEVEPISETTPLIRDGEESKEDEELPKGRTS